MNFTCFLVVAGESDDVAAGRSDQASSDEERKKAHREKRALLENLKLKLFRRKSLFSLFISMLIGMSETIE